MGVFRQAALLACVGLSVASCSKEQPRENHKQPEHAAGHGAHGSAAGPSSAEVAFLFAGGDDKGWTALVRELGHPASRETSLAELPDAVSRELARKLALTSQLVKLYPTPKEAEAAGYRRRGPFVPGQGVHWLGGVINTSGTLTDDEILRPSTLIYDGLTQDAPIAGFMYISRFADGKDQPEGFDGPNDQWHGHVGLCRGRERDGAAEYFRGTYSVEACRALGGTHESPPTTMVHVWSVPAYTSALGVFSALNPALTCPDGTYHLSDDKGDIPNRCRSTTKS